MHLLEAAPLSASEKKPKIADVSTVQYLKSLAMPVLPVQHMLETAGPNLAGSDMLSQL